MSVITVEVPSATTGNAGSQPASLGVIADARYRQRRRRKRLAAATAIAAVAILAGLGVGGVGFSSRSLRVPPQLGSAPVVPADTVFSQAAYAGISCPGTDCDGVGIAVWLTAPAAVTVVIGGRAARLDDPTWDDVYWTGAGPPGTLTLVYRYAGFLPLEAFPVLPHLHGQATSTWLVTHHPSGNAWFRIDYNSRRAVITHTAVPISPGWG